MATTVTILSENDKRLVHTLALGLAENLLYHYPASASETPDAARVQCWLNEILEHIQQQQQECSGDGTATDASTYTTDNENDRTMAQLVMKEGIRRWKSKASIFAKNKAGAGSKQTSMTFSFLDQWNAGGTGGGLSLLDSIITWDRIQQETTLDSKLKLLLKVQHMDDIHPDWDKVCPLLLQGLQQQLQNTTATDNSNDDEDVLDFIKLHETLFEQSRSSPEYTTAQIQLCQNIVTQLQATLALLSTTTTSDYSPMTRLLRRLVRAFWNMWMDWMVSRGGGPNSNVNLVESIGRDVWSCYGYKYSYKGTGSKTTSQDLFPSVLMRVMMLEQDPYARWFTSWVAHLPPLKVVSLMECSGAPHLFASMVLACENTTTRWNDGDSDSDNHDNDNKNRDALSRHSLVLLASILRQTRVSLFPWQTDIMHGGATVSMSSLFAVFHDTIERELQWLTIPTDSAKLALRATDWERIQVCADAMETLLWGFSETDPNTFRKLLNKLDNTVRLSLALTDMDLTDVCLQVHELLHGVQRRLLRDR
jgi:hypothetical protein